MGSSSLRSAGTRLLIASLICFMLSASFVVSGQTNENSPLERVEDQSSMTERGLRPNTILAADPPVFIKGDVDNSFTVRFRCTKSDGSLTGCQLGEGSGTGSSTRTVYLHYNLTGGAVDLSANSADKVALTTTANLPNSRSTLTFTGTLGAAKLADTQDGDTITWAIRVPMQNVGAGSCGGTTTCVDPIHTTGEQSYSARIDKSTPTIVVSDPSNANALRISETEWYLYSNTAMSNRLPSITVSVIDNVTGAPLDVNSIKLFRAKSDNTSNFQRTKVTDWGYSYFYTYSSSGALSFQSNTATRIDVVAKDISGHRLDTVNRTEPAVWVVMDNTTPVLTVKSDDSGKGGSHMKRHSGTSGLAALGEEMRIYVNATDIAGRKSDNSILNTPKELLQVTLRFQGGANNDTFSAPITIPYNETACKCFHTANASLPTSWVNGVTYANITVTDPVGQSVSRGIQGAVNVDVETPVIVPERPLDDTVSSDFTNTGQVTFRVRASDPGDEDDWQGSQTGDSDFFGIALDSVKVRYKIGQDGVLRTGKLNPQEAESTFQWVNTFGSEDAVYYYFEAKDLAGNLATYPTAADKHVALNVTQNGGRFLFLLIDQQGPAIEPARDLTWLGKGPHELDFTVTDGGIGVEDQTVKLFWRSGTSGSFQELQLVKDTNNQTVYKASIPTQEDGTSVQYYVAASDKLGNAATLGSVGSPRTAKIDLTAPSVNVNAPETTTESTFNVTWSATDTGSGVQDYTLQFRIAPGGEWFTVPSRTETELTFYEICAATGKTYEFRLSARDRAGNERAFPDNADASTFVDAATSCAKAPEVTVSQPKKDTTLSGPIDFAWAAVSTTSPGDLQVSLHVGTGSDFQTIQSGLADQGTYTWNSASLDLTVLCVPDGTYTLRVIAADPNGLEGRRDIGPVTIENGIADCEDRDHDGLPDAWEMAQFGDLSQGPEGDEDGDGFSNLEEFRDGTDPNDESSKPNVGGKNNGGDVTISGWSNAYILVILGFVAVLAVFVIGMTRRW